MQFLHLKSEMWGTHDYREHFSYQRFVFGRQRIGVL